MTASIYLIRHGMTLANREDRFAGRTDEPLHAEGVMQIREIGHKLREIGLAAIYAGPLPRTMQSAEILSDLCGIRCEVEAGLTDIHLPHWDGLTKEEIRQRFGRQYPTWKESPESFRVEGCETLTDVQQRAVRSVEQIRARDCGRKVLLVTHLIVARCLILHYSGRPLVHFRSIKVDNGDVIRL
jgi:broad specificity phosphatase PhoE